MLDHVLNGATISSGFGLATVKIPAEGRTAITVTAMDFEQNWATATEEVAIDQTAPAMSVSLGDGAELARNSLVHLNY